MERKPSEVDQQAWSAERRIELVLSIVRGSMTAMQAASLHDLPVEQVERWVEVFLTAGRSALSAEAPNSRPAGTEASFRKPAAPILLALVFRLLSAIPPWLVLALLIGILGLHAWYYWPFFSDDALISLRYARRLAEGHGLTWTDGERVEGYTDLLWVLLMAGARALRVDLISAARRVDFIGCALAIGMVSFTPSRPLRLSSMRLWTGGLALCLCAPLAVWAIGGLEHGLMTGVVAVALVFCLRAVDQPALAKRDLWVAGGALCALALLRADGIVLGLCVGAGVLISRRICRRTLWELLLLVGPPLACLALQLAFRRIYYGQLVPNTALAKVSLSSHRLVAGLRHVRDGYTPLLPLLALVATSVSILWGRVARGRYVIPLVVSLGWSAYLAVVGGDIFPGWRQLLLGIVPLCFVIAEGAQGALARWPRAPWLAPAFVVPTLAGGLYVQLRDPENLRAKNEIWEWDGQAVGPDLRRALHAKQPLLAVDAAGALPYWSDLPTLDMLGLSDRYIATHPPASFGTGGIGHELGDGAYVLRRSPDLIAFNSAAGGRNPVFLSGRQMVPTAEFQRLYQFVRVRGQSGNRAVGELWFRREDGKLAVTRSSERIEIPGYYFANADAVAELDGSDLVTVVTPKAVAELPRLRVPAGRWTLTLEPPSVEVQVGFRCAGLSAVPTGRGEGLSVEGHAALDIVVGTTAAEFRIRSATLSRISKDAAFACPGNPTRVPMEALANVKGENAYWAGPTNIVFRNAGLHVVLSAPSYASTIDMSLDNNDDYRIKFLRGQERVGEVVFGKRRNGGGLAVHKGDIPLGAQQRGFDQIEVVPEQGDGNYSLGHLVIGP